MLSRNDSMCIFPLNIHFLLSAYDITNMESPLTMVLHGFIIAIVIYLLLRFALGQADEVAQSRAILFGLLSASYMIVFGHGLPNKVNPNLM